MDTPIESTPRQVSFERMDERMVEALRAMSERQRLEIAWDMWRSASNMIESMLRDEHPDWTDRQLAIEIGRRLLGPELSVDDRERIQAIEVLKLRKLTEPSIGGNKALD